MGPPGPAGCLEQSFLFAWASQGQSLDPAPEAGSQGPAVAFTGSVLSGSALSYTSPAEINILESGYYHISWQVYKTGYDSAFALFYGSGGAEQSMVPGSNYGAMSHDENYQGQAIAFLAEGGVLTLNRIDNLGTQSILNQIGGGTPVTGASIVVIQIGRNRP